MCPPVRPNYERLRQRLRALETGLLEPAADANAIPLIELLDSYTGSDDDEDYEGFIDESARFDADEAYEEAGEIAEQGLTNLVQPFFQDQPIDMMDMIRKILQFAAANDGAVMHSLLVDEYNWRTSNDEEVRENMSTEVAAFFERLETVSCTEPQYLRDTLHNHLQELPAEFQVANFVLLVAVKLCDPQRSGIQRYIGYAALNGESLSS